MSIEPMEKIHLVALKQDKDPILKALEKCQLVDIQTFSANKEEALPLEEVGQHEFNLAEIKSTISFLDDIAELKKSFIETFVPPKEETTEEEINQTVHEFEAKKVIADCKAIESQLANLNNLKKELHSEHDKLLPWTTLNLKLSTLNNLTQTKVVLGTVKTKGLHEFQNKATALSPAASINLVNQDKNTSYLAIIFLKAEEKALTDLLTKSGWQEASLPNIERSPKEEIDNIQGLLKKAELERSEHLAAAKKLIHHTVRLKYLYDHILGLKSNQELQAKFADTNYTFVIEGWVKQKMLTEVKKRLNEVSKNVAVYKIQPAEGEKPPVALKNPGILSPFELITKIYGTPKSDEPDPTLPLSFFFALFFGLCLGDFGYGVVLGLVSIYFLKKYKLPAGGQNLFKLLLIGGGFSAIVGILTGSYFGFNPQNIPTSMLPLKHLLLSIRIIDPIKSPLVMLVFSLALGVIQILYGISIQLIHHLKQKEYVAAFLDDGLWFFFLASIVFLIVSSATGSLSHLSPIAKNMTIAGAVLLVLTQGRHKKNVIQKFLSGLLSLYKLSGYMGDTLSYSRLLALGMSSAIIGSVINILAGMVREVPIFGIILMVILLIFGHIFNLLVSTLGAFVHSIRLQMVEFFSKFFEGGGREFRPYKRVAEYTIIK
ncbi:hypothetical protein A2291_01745 [candidate division WOR-1 bacterium RIFOXYB2_FULL_42_35]|uniref:Uncharacterized protein n=1 Tax=candidate division WOR-1 bacterium RIFOXYC2_FULL_41_25 TaxID=1802586 RepID=A0A1F4TQ65_UNCSA|nr:MAG: hypothetical protein A2247_03545 [candidate division WOR-1 bacterium RIFOXYA2_FULL_41_14]OGC25468.1 MAG: hypothetical protein A2291_01745 [candidate division WOR-1 bacterium RIFOXYB2_FULL_42_35]OGC34874.1 MAG: hypothetical protein A2462_05680 [candidate division WOR-1 bacterium RIFOXYC2_FULL_41_25]OGC42128.1 MAG: hypothetical protein A2548_01975 [candidate division WOR-1 bacterium RIFOXYD2_FULL_41_8]